ncbi:hypothetical protein [Altererythrobacter sp. GH1-8]|uniref:hypothetical protein n=1 Tax=Altererythrobacter sp. GH1-8 TaxID=3349333 RepID=UPI00374D3390
MATLSEHIDAGFGAVERMLSPRIVWLALAGGVLVFQVFLIWNHKPWADELQALMIALEAPNQATLLAWLRYEGHPPLWYWLLRTIGSFAEPHIVLPLAATLCAAIAQGAILFTSPFSRLERLLLASSQYLLFEFLTISRGTSLGVAVVVLALVAWRSRWFWLLLAVLPLVDFLFGVISGVFLLLKWRERDLWWPGILLWLIASAFAAWTVIPPPDMVNAIDAMQPLHGIDLLLHNLRGWFLKLGSIPLPFPGGLMAEWKAPVVPIASYAWILLLALCWYCTKQRPWHRLMIFGFLGFTLAFNLAVYSIGLRHMLLVALLLIALVWLARAAGDKPGTAFRVWIFFASLCGIASSLISTERGFSNGDAVLTQIEARGLSERTWLAIPEWRVPAISGRSSLSFVRPEEGCRFRFVRWDHKSLALENQSNFTAMLRHAVENYGQSYMLSDRKFAGFDPDLLTELVRIPPGYDGITYYLYVVGPQAPEKQNDLPWCYAQVTN